MVSSAFHTQYRQAYWISAGRHVSIVWGSALECNIPSRLPSRFHGGGSKMITSSDHVTRVEHATPVQAEDAERRKSGRVRQHWELEREKKNSHCNEGLMPLHRRCLLLDMVRVLGITARRGEVHSESRAIQRVCGKNVSTWRSLKGLRWNFVCGW